jgi:queuine tRNA-ribosyltransferase
MALTASACYIHAMPFRFELEHTSCGARAGRMTTDHGVVETPVFMPVGTQATVKATPPSSLAAEAADGGIDARVILGNAYHLVLRPGVDVIEAAGGLHGFMGWGRAILTDSGGFQVFSLADLRKVEDRGITFRSHVDGSLHLFTPESVIEAQARIGADIVMSFDHCTRLPCERAEAQRAVELTTAWARRGLAARGPRFRHHDHEQVVFGIVQGASYADLRRRSLAELVEMDFPGYALGGLSVGESKEETWEMTEVVAEGLPRDRPRYLMGVGTPLDLVDGVSRGVDMFDCVMPTRNGRNGTVFTSDGKMVLKNACYANDFRPIDEDCGCQTCRRFTRAYLRHLFVAREILGPVLATHHSLYFYCDTMRRMRGAIERDEFETWRREFAVRYASGEEERARRNRYAN